MAKTKTTECDFWQEIINQIVEIKNELDLAYKNFRRQLEKIKTNFIKERLKESQIQKAWQEYQKTTENLQGRIKIINQKLDQYESDRI